MYDFNNEFWDFFWSKKFSTAIELVDGLMEKYPDDNFVLGNIFYFCFLHACGDRDTDYHDPDFDLFIIPLLKYLVISYDVDMHKEQEVILKTALIMNDVDFAKDLVNDGADLERAVNDIVPNIFMKGSTDSIKFIIESDINPGYDVLYTAVSYKNEGIIKYLINRGIKITDRSFQVAVRHNLLSIVQLMIDTGTYINYSDSIMISIFYRLTEMTDLLLKTGAVIKQIKLNDNNKSFGISNMLSKYNIPDSQIITLLCMDDNDIKKIIN